MSRRKKRRVHVRIGRINIINVIRDVVHQRGGATVAVREIEANGVGGDIVNAKAKTKTKQAKPRKGNNRLTGAASRVIMNVIIGIAGVAGSVAAAGVAHAIGWG